ncbi:MAG: proline--tRNA ligase [Planctomycetes bacterium]|nr:proline--tRNA ligase [Planctomycetota bacterium]
MRYSRMLIPTQKETPQDATLPSHMLMIRGGYIRPLAAGTFTYLPLGIRTLHKVTEIVRQEMVRSGAEELLMPALQPLSIWQETGRDEIFGPVLFRFDDRRGRSLALGTTHEEVITDIARSYLRSYRQLPLNLFQIQTKFRDEERPRGGLIRTREFIMKDAYSFDRDEAGLDASYQAMYQAYSRIFSRCGLDYVPVEADSGAIGGSVSHEFMVPSPHGEDSMVTCGSCGYAANVERCELPAMEEIPAGTAAVEEVETPGTTTIEQVSSFLKVSPDRLLKTLIYTAGEKIVLALVRGDHELNEAKLARAVGAPIEMADGPLVEKISGAAVGFAGPVGMNDRGAFMVADNAVKAMADFVTGANKNDAHLLNVNRERDFAPDVYADIRAAGEGDACPRCGGALSFVRAIEVGHVFKLGTRYSEMMNAGFLDDAGKNRPFVMGCYGIGVSRIPAAAIETHHDEKGIVWPITIAPFEVLLIPTNPTDQALMQHAEALYSGLLENGVDVLLDDRDERAGVKFNDAELIGVPVRITVGPRGIKNGVFELKLRDGSMESEIPLAEGVAAVSRIRNELVDRLSKA